MTTNENNKKKSNKARKLVPAAGMLAISAAMLASSTYAWFTMSREVEVKNISMTATVPEDLQISLGALGADGNDASPTSSGATYSLANSTGRLVSKTSGNAGNDNVMEPGNISNFWANSADISAYYSLGRIIPASSSSGTNIFFTPDANQAGQNIKLDARFIEAANGLSAVADSGTTATGTGRGTYAASLHAIVKDGDPWAAPSGTGYSGATAWNNTHDDGYYVDVPVWIRSSSDSAVTLKASAYVLPKTDTKLTEAEVELYRAARVAIIPADSNTGTGTAGVMNLMDGAPSGVTDAAQKGWKSTVSVVDYYGESANHGVASGAVKKAGQSTGYDYGTSSSSGSLASFYEEAKVYNGTSTIVTVPAHTTSDTSSQYGTPVKVYIRVWLEGEDKECWNQNAGQDFSINIKFERNEASIS